MIFYHDWTGGIPKSHDLILFPLANWYTSTVTAQGPVLEAAASVRTAFCFSESIDGEKWQADQYKLPESSAS